MRRAKQSALVLLLAIAQVLVGATLLCTGGCGIANSAGGTSATVTINKGGKQTTMVYDTREEMEREAPGYKTIDLASAIGGLALAVAALVAAVGLLVRRSWGWWL